MFWPNLEITIMNIIRQSSLIAILATVVLATSACSNMSSRDKSTAAGAGIGAILTGGSAVGTVGGAAVGGVIGSQVGKD